MVCATCDKRRKMLYPFLNMGAIAALRRRRNYLLYKEKLMKSMNDDWDQLDREIWVCSLFFCLFMNWVVLESVGPGAVFYIIFSIFAFYVVLSLA